MIYPAVLQLALGSFLPSPQQHLPLICLVIPLIHRHNNPLKTRHLFSYSLLGRVESFLFFDRKTGYIEVGLSKQEDEEVADDRQRT